MAWQCSAFPPANPLQLDWTLHDRNPPPPRCTIAPLSPLPSHIAISVLLFIAKVTGSRKHCHNHDDFFTSSDPYS